MLEPSRVELDRHGGYDESSGIDPIEVAKQVNEYAAQRLRSLYRVQIGLDIPEILYHPLYRVGLTDTGALAGVKTIMDVMVKLGMAPYYGLQDDRRNQDFCVFVPDRRKKDGSALPVYIEVKYSQNSMIAVDTLKAYTKYENCACVFALFDNDGIYILDRRDLGKIKGEKVYFKNCPPLSEHRLFSFTKAEKIAARIFSKTFIPAFFGGLLSYRDMKKKLTQDLQQMMRGNDNGRPGMKFRK